MTTEYTVIALGSLSPIKRSALSLALSRRELRKRPVFANVEVCEKNSPSGVPNQPFDMHQTRLGAFSRASNARELVPSCKFAIGIENGLMGLGNQEWIDIAVVCLLSSECLPIYTTSIGLPMPRQDVVESIASDFTKTAGQRMSERRPSKPADPHWTITGGEFNRESLLADAVFAAFATWLARIEDGGE